VREVAHQHSAQSSDEDKHAASDDIVLDLAGP